MVHLAAFLAFPEFGHGGRDIHASEGVPINFDLRVDLVLETRHYGPDVVFVYNIDVCGKFIDSFSLEVFPGFVLRDNIDISLKVLVCLIFYILNLENTDERFSQEFAGVLCTVVDNVRDFYFLLEGDRYSAPFFRCSNVAESRDVL